MRSRIKDVLFKVGTAAVCVLAYAMTSRFEKHHFSFYWEPQEDWYGLTAKAISRSTMWSSDKTEALQTLLGNGPEGYYQSVIAIVNSNMWSSDKLTAIKRESAKFADVIIM